jgi:uncharacterized membrane protein
MPMDWTLNEKAPAQTGAFLHSAEPPLARVILRPNRSLPRVGFAWLFLIIRTALTIPLVLLVGSLALWVVWC